MINHDLTDNMKLQENTVMIIKIDFASGVNQHISVNILLEQVDIDQNHFMSPPNSKLSGVTN